MIEGELMSLPWFCCRPGLRTAGELLDREDLNKAKSIKLWLALSPLLENHQL